MSIYIKILERKKVYINRKNMKKLIENFIEENEKEYYLVRYNGSKVVEKLANELIETGITDKEELMSFIKNNLPTNKEHAMNFYSIIW